MPSTLAASPGLLSDVVVTSGKASVVSKLQRYSDLDLSLYLDKTITKGDIVPLEDIVAVKNSVRNLILSNSYDRPFRPYLGGNIRALLFEPADMFTLYAMSSTIKNMLRRFEPRVDQVNVRGDFDEDRNEYFFTLGFRVITQNIPVDMTVRLVRLR